MTKVYRLRTDIAQYKEIVLDVEEIAEQLNADHRIMDFVYMGVKDKRLADSWGHVTSDFEASPVYLYAVEIPTMCVWTGPNLIFSEKAHAIFRLMLEDYGEFLPIDVTGHTFYIFNNLTDVEPDLEQSSHTNADLTDIKTIKFKADQDRLLFKSNWEGSSCCFCSDRFKELYDEYEMTGFVFSEDLLDPGYLKG